MPETDAMDPASKALTDALRISFFVLKLVIIVVLALFVFSGFYRVDESERALVLRFGDIQGAGPSAVREPGLHWRWPYVDEIIRVPAPGKQIVLEVDSFWYDDPKRPGRPSTDPGQTLQFARDGYSLTASGDLNLSFLGVNVEAAPPKDDLFTRAAPDYNIVHSKWVIRYSVTKPLNFVERLWDGTPAGWERVETLLRNLLADAVIVVSANRSIDWMIWEAPLDYRDQVQFLMRQNLNQLNLGLEAELVLQDLTTPRQVEPAFNLAASARDESRTLVINARGQASQIINQAQEADAKDILAEASKYHDTVVKAAQADADYLTKLITTIKQAAQQRVSGDGDDPQIQQQRQQVYNELLAVSVDQLYQEMLRDVLDHADEVFVLSATKGAKVEWRPMLSRDATLEKQKKTSNAGNQ